MSKIQVYFVPGLAAGKEIFKNIVLPPERYDIHVLEWLIPEKEESIVSYAKRMAARILVEEVVLVGVSFGGVVVQEMSAFLNVKKLIIISSVKCREELPTRIKLASATKAYKLVPTGLASSAQDLTSFAIGPRSKKRLRLYNEYLSVRDKVYLDWAIAQMVNWGRKEIDKNVVHIHGDQDAIFPMKYIKEALIVEGGTHVMILNKGSKISTMLVSIIENY
jgi:pimeloyl-ACP methyl ester carboxylesterase